MDRERKNLSVQGQTPVPGHSYVNLATVGVHSLPFELISSGWKVLGFFRSWAWFLIFCVSLMLWIQGLELSEHFACFHILCDILLQEQFILIIRGKFRVFFETFKCRDSKHSSCINQWEIHYCSVKGNTEEIHEMCMNICFTGFM